VLTNASKSVQRYNLAEDNAGRLGRQVAVGDDEEEEEEEDEDESRMHLVHAIGLGRLGEAVLSQGPPALLEATQRAATAESGNTAASL
jgi:hypothetical protein